MKTALQFTSWFAIVLGILAIIGGITTVDVYGNSSVDWYAVFGGSLFLSQGILSLAYISQTK